MANRKDSNRAGSSSDEEYAFTSTNAPDSAGEPKNCNAELENFTRTWKNEILQRNDARRFDSAEEADSQSDQPEQLYQRAMRFEQSGLMLEAVRCYRRALRLVPDLETSFRNSAARPAFPGASTVRRKRMRESVGSGALVDDFRRALSSRAGGRTVYCSPERPSRRGEPHVGSLPAEVLLRIFRWVVSDEVDARQLDQLAGVCRGFYVLSRDSELWRSCCLRIWGAEASLSDPENRRPYASWREMFLDRPHLFFNGIYISKTSYIRKGEECSFLRHNFYQPWHMVVYFRYVRFLANGTILMLTSTDEPDQVVPTMRSPKTCNNKTLVGTYKLVEPDRISAFLKQKGDGNEGYVLKQRSAVEIEQTFKIELRIESTKQRQHCRLHWMNYWLYRKRRQGGSETETLTSFSLTDCAFPSLFFSRVRSYAAESEAPL